MTTFEIADAIVIIVMITVILVSLRFEKTSGISSTPVLPWTRRQALSLLKKHSPDHKDVHSIAELGCGWGGMVQKLHAAYPKAQIVGYEVSPLPYYLCKLRFAFTRKTVTILRPSFFDCDLSNFDIVFCYLSPKHMEKLKPQLLNLKKGSMVVSCSFPLTEWKPVEVQSVWSIVRIPVYIYRI